MKFWKKKVSDPRLKAQPAGSRLKASDEATDAKRDKVVFSYYGSGTIQSSDLPRKTQEETRWPGWLQKAPLIFLLVVIATSLIYNATLTPGVRINNAASVEKTDIARSTQTYQQALADLFTKSVLNHSKLTFQAAKLEENFRKQFPEVSDIDLTVPLVGRRMSANLSFASPGIILSGQGGSYVLDDRGKVLLPSSELRSSLSVPTVHDESGLSLSPGSYTLSGSEVSFITTLAAQFAAKQMIIEDMTLPAIPKELHVRVQGSSYIIKFFLDGDPELSFGTFLATKTRLDANGTVPKEYIDVRVEERAYYK